MSASVLATVKGVVPPPRRRSSAPVGMGRPRPVTSSSVGVSIPVQEAAIPVAYNLPPLAGAGGPPTRALHHFVVTRLRLSSGGPAGMPAPLDEVEVPGAALAAGGVLNAPGCSPLTVSLPSLTGWTVELGGEEPRLVVTTPTGRYYLVGRPAAAYVAVHGRSRARRRYELLVRAVALATHLPPADATYAKVVRQLGRRAAGMRAYTEADVLAERSFLLAQGWALDDPALRCSLFAQELARRGREISGPGSPPPACPPLGTGSSGPAGQAADPAHPKKRKRTVSLKGPVGDRPGGVAAKRRATAGVASSSKASPSGAAAASPSDADVAVGPRCACAGAPGGCGGSAPAAAGSKYASDACGMARARQRVTEMAAAGVDVDSFVRVHVEPLSRQPCL
eukprot:contig_33336_g8054